MNYVDATTNNTTLSTGAPLSVGPGINQWHERPGTGNGGSVLASADVIGENAPPLKTLLPLPGPGTYDLWVNFWGNPGSDWRIMAGLSATNLQIFRQSASKAVEPGDHVAALVLTNDNNAYLYQAYLGRVTVTGSNTVPVFVDDNAIPAGSTNPLTGDSVRTWYDGLSYAEVSHLQITNAAHDAGTTSITWTSTPPETSLALPTYTIQKQTSLADPSWTVLATGLPSIGSTTTYTDLSATGTAGFYRISAP
jgi:hypothetical protein